MTRSLSTANDTAAKSASPIAVLFAKLEFDGGNVMVHSWLGDISFGGDTYTGVGDLGTVSPIDEDTELSRSNLSLELSGIPSSMISIALGQQYQGRPVTIFIGFLDQSTGQLVDTPAQLPRMRMDTMDIEASNETLRVTVSAENRFAAWDKPLTRRYNDADQQGRYPGDKGLQYVEQSTEKVINWGQKKQ